MPRVSPTAFSAAALLLLFLFADPLRSQSTTATLNGQVTDPRGAVVPNAAVEAVNIDTGVASATRSNGDPGNPAAGPLIAGRPPCRAERVAVSGWKTLAGPIRPRRFVRRAPPNRLEAKLGTRTARRHRRLASPGPLKPASIADGVGYPGPGKVSEPDRGCQ